MRIFRLGLASFVTAVAMFASAAQAQPIVMRFVTLAAPNWIGATDLIRPWAARVQEQSKGTLEIQVVDGFSLANYGNVYDRVMDDVVQISVGGQSSMGGMFMRTDVVSLPFMGDGSEKASVALWKLYASGMIAEEYKNLKVLGLFVPPQGGIHTRKTRISTLADVQGLRLRGGGKVLSDVISALGGAPSSIAPSETYTALQRGTIDGTIFPWTIFTPYKLAEVTSEHLDVQLGAGQLMVFMSQKKFDSLPEDARKAIDANSGESMSRKMGQLFDQDRDRERDAVRATKGHTISELAPAELARWKETVKPIADNWSKTVPNGEKILEAYAKEMK